MKITNIATEKDKLDNTVLVMHSDSLVLSPIYTFFLRQMANLIDSGLGYADDDWKEKNCSVVYATTEDGKILGHIVYEHKSNETLFIILGAVDEQARGRGIYTLLHKYFEQVAKEKGCWAITSFIHKNNKISLASAEKLGKKPIMYLIGKKLT